MRASATTCLRLMASSNQAAIRYAQQMCPQVFEDIAQDKRLHNAAFPRNQVFEKHFQCLVRVCLKTWLSAGGVCAEADMQLMYMQEGLTRAQAEHIAGAGNLLQSRSSVLHRQRADCLAVLNQASSGVCLTGMPARDCGDRI